MSEAPLLATGSSKKVSAKQKKKRIRNLFTKLRASVNIKVGAHQKNSTSVPSSDAMPSDITTAISGGEQKTAMYRHHAELTSPGHDATASVLAHPEHGISDGESGDESGVDTNETPNKKKLTRSDYFHAAFLLLHSRTGRGIDGQRFDEEALGIYLLVHSPYWIGAYCCIAVLHMTLGLLNTNSKTPGSWEYTSMGLEVFVLLGYTLDIWLIYILTASSNSDNPSITRANRGNHVEKKPSPQHSAPNLVASHWNRLRVILTFAFIVDLLIYICTKNMAYRFCTFLRPLMLVLRRREFRHMMRAVFFSAKRILRVLSLMAFHIVFSGFVAFVFFSTVNHEQTKFKTLPESILEMLLIVTSPGAVLPAMQSVYAASQGWAALFFVIFVIIGNMVIYKVVLATAYRSFKSFMKGELIRKMRNKHECCTCAFDMLADDGTMNAQVWRRLFLQMQEQHVSHWLCLKHHHGEGLCWGIFDCFCCKCARSSKNSQTTTRENLKQRYRRAMRRSRSRSTEVVWSSAETQASRRNIHRNLLHYRLVANAIFNEIDSDNSGLIERSDFDQGIELARVSSVRVLQDQGHSSRSVRNSCCGSFLCVGKARSLLRYMFEFDILQCKCFAQAQGGITPDGALTMRKLDHHHQFPVADLFIDALVVLSCVSIFFDTEARIQKAGRHEGNGAGVHGIWNETLSHNLVNGSEDLEFRIWSVIGTIAMVLFFAEVCLRVFAFGLREYLQMPMHKLDMFCVAIGLIFFLVTWVDANIGTNGNPLYNLFLVLRASRMIRLLWFFAPLRGMLWTVGMLVPSLFELLSILFVPMYMGASLGNVFLGECLVYPIQNPNINVTAPATSQLISKWLPLGDMLQFDTPGRAMLDMFEMANIASWNVVMDAGSALCAPQWASPLFFFTVRIVLHMVFIPIIVGFIIEQFVKKFEWWEHHEDESLNKIHTPHPIQLPTDSYQTTQHNTQQQAENGSSQTDGRTNNKDSLLKGDPKHKVIASKPLHDGIHEIHVRVKENPPRMEGAPSDELDIFNVGADIAAQKAKDLEEENESLYAKIELLEAAVAKAHVSLGDARKKERKMQRQIDTLRSELKKRLEEHREAHS